VQGIAIWLGVDRDGLEPGVTAGADDADGDFTTVE
jgi:hypothetical protein